MLRLYKFVQRNLTSYAEMSHLNDKTSRPSLTIAVQLSEGRVLGQRTRFTNGLDINVFRGIPYAQPPVGELRFQPPQPLKKFKTDPLECFHNGPYSVQPDLLKRGAVLGSEDCLHLNIYTPSEGGSGKLPVIVWFPGGGFSIGGSSDEIYSPEHLVAENVLLVSVNYRLGPLGFLSYPEGGILGNAGLKDQQLALKWISRNIERFGGDSGNVTIFGQSSGATSCHLHLLNAESRPLFHKLILQSGCAKSGWALPKNPSEKAVQLSELISGNRMEPGDPKKVTEILQNASAEQLTKLASKTVTPMEDRNVMKIPFGAVVEPKSPLSFLTEHPGSLVKSFRNDSHPMILGFNSQESFHMTHFFKRAMAKYQADDGFYVPYTLNVAEGSAKFQEASQELKQFYNAEGSFSLDNLLPMMTAIMDNHFWMTIMEIQEYYRATQSQAPLFCYEFGYSGAFNEFRLPPVKGPIHNDELFYLFRHRPIGNISPDVEPADEESNNVRKLMCGFWANFARSGDPNGSNGFNWRKYGENSQTLLISDSKDVKMTRNEEYERRFQFWKYIHKKYETEGKL